MFNHQKCLHFLRTSHAHSNPITHIKKVMEKIGPLILPTISLFLSKIDQEMCLDSFEHLWTDILPSAPSFEIQLWSSLFHLAACTFTAAASLCLRKLTNKGQHQCRVCVSSPSWSRPCALLCPSKRKFILLLGGTVANVGYAALWGWADSH